VAAGDIIINPPPAIEQGIMVVWQGFLASLRRGAFPLAFFARPNLQHTCCRWQMNLQPKPGSWGPHHCCKIASILQHACCKLQVAKSLREK